MEIKACLVEPYSEPSQGWCASFDKKLIEVAKSYKLAGFLKNEDLSSFILRARALGIISGFEHAISLTTNIPATGR